MLRIEHQDAGAHALQNLSVKCFQVGHVGRALLREGFAELQAPAQPLDEQCRGEAQRAEAAGLDELTGGLRVADAEVSARSPPRPLPAGRCARAAGCWRWRPKPP
ncbi:hypothetical protein D3C85_1404130 [compost metagenome]